METGRFQPAIEQERFGRGPFGAEGLSGSFVRAAFWSDRCKAKSWRPFPDPQSLPEP
nr:hypothetical protein [Desulfitobacterium hafniense]